MVHLVNLPQRWYSEREEVIHYAKPSYGGG
jgi:hypothetical protein